MILLEAVVEGILGVYDGTNSYIYLVPRQIHKILIKKRPKSFSAGYEFQPSLYLGTDFIRDCLQRDLPRDLLQLQDC